MRTFSMGGKTVTVNIEETVKDYFQESLNGHWACIPVIIECGAQEYNIAEAQYLLGMSYMEGIDRTKNVDEGMKWLKSQQINIFQRQWENLALIVQTSGSEN